MIEKQKYYQVLPVVFVTYDGTDSRTLHRMTLGRYICEAPDKRFTWVRYLLHKDHYSTAHVRILRHLLYHLHRWIRPVSLRGVLSDYKLCVSCISITWLLLNAC